MKPELVWHCDSAASVSIFSILIYVYSNICNVVKQTSKREFEMTKKMQDHHI